MHRTALKLLAGAGALAALALGGSALADAASSGSDGKAGSGPSGPRWYGAPPPGGAAGKGTFRPPPGAPPPGALRFHRGAPPKGFRPPPGATPKGFRPPPGALRFHRGGPMRGMPGHPCPHGKMKGQDGKAPAEPGTQKNGSAPAASGQSSKI